MLDEIKEELFRDDPVVYIPFRELLIEFKPHHFDEVVDVLLTCEGFTEDRLLQTRSALPYYYRELKKRANTEIDTQMRCDLYDFIRDVMEVFVASCVIKYDMPAYVSVAIRKLFINKKILSLSGVNAPDFKLDRYLSEAIRR